jgi:hypothetical protein
MALTNNEVQRFGIEAAIPVEPNEAAIVSPDHDRHRENKKMSDELLEGEIEELDEGDLTRSSDGV